MSLEHLFDAELKYRPGMPPITTDGEGRLIGSGDGVARGEKIGGTFHWTLFEQPGELVCQMNPILVVATGDVAEVRVEGRGYARRESPDDSLWQVAATLHLRRPALRLAQPQACCLGEFDAKEERARYRAYVRLDSEVAA